MAILPVIVFAAGAAWLGSYWTLAATIILGISHILASFIIAKAKGTVRSSV
ncbi:hypothetical protein [Nakamurella alba]|uniref:hypothetical protein n=1 Tax=Nakamurella alba TaxID=2665158 RepID=UPI001E3EB378|nr:hypothetical protein [Nakamurella alba]